MIIYFTIIINIAENQIIYIIPRGFGKSNPFRNSSISPNANKIKYAKVIRSL